jgi:hypothetical protein
MDVTKAILEELVLSQRIIRVELAPRFSVFTPEAKYVAFMALPEDPVERRTTLRLVRLFMVGKAATGFMLPTELHTPVAHMVVAVTREKAKAGIQRISREPLLFHEIEWHGADAIDSVLLTCFRRRWWPSPARTWN